MPEHAEREPPRRILDRLDGAVIRVSRDSQAGPEPPEALMVVRLHRRLLAEQLAEASALLQHDVVIREDPRCVLVAVVTDVVGEVLHEIATRRDVEDLRPAADREHRHVARERGPQQRQLGAVALGDDAPRLGMRILPVELGVEIRAAGEDDGVERVERLLDRRVERRDEQRPPTRALDRADVMGRDERSLLVPRAETRRRQIRRDSDHGSSHGHGVSPNRYAARRSFSAMKTRIAPIGHSAAAARTDSSSVSAARAIASERSSSSITSGARSAQMP